MENQLIDFKVKNYDSNMKKFDFWYEKYQLYQEKIDFKMKNKIYFEVEKIDLIMRNKKFTLRFLWFWCEKINFEMGNQL